MENTFGFLEEIGYDMWFKILMCLDDPADLVRFSCVARYWQQFVISEAFLKRLCIKMFPELLCLTHVEVYYSDKHKAESSNVIEWENLKKEHKAYAHLAHHLTSDMEDIECINQAISASSTDNYPEESIDYTLKPGDAHQRYWSSKGERNPDVPETLTYKLTSSLCLINEINIQPFQAFFQYGHPIYSARAVRFKMGWHNSSMNSETSNFGKCQEFNGGNYRWLYISPQFPMAQENRLQKFKLPRAVLCVGGILQIELLGRVQTQEVDDLYYICVCHVKALGHPLPPTFGFEVDSNEKCKLLHFPKAIDNLNKKKTGNKGTVSSRLSSFSVSFKQLGTQRWDRVVLRTLLGPSILPSDDESDEDK